MELIFRLEPQTGRVNIKSYFSGRAVAVFRDHDLGPVHLVLFFGFFKVYLIVPVYEHHQVGVLLDRTRISQVGQPRFVALSLFNGSRQLRNGYYWYVQFFGYSLQTSRYLGYLLYGTVVISSRGHYLKIIDYKHALFALRPK